MEFLLDNYVCSKWQTALLTILKNKIENSKTYIGKNKVNQSFKCSPDEIYADYYSDYADLDLLDEIKSDFNQLQQMGLVLLELGNNDIRKICAIYDRYSDYCILLNAVSKRSVINEYIDVLKSHMNRTRTVDNICESQLLRIDNNKDVNICDSPRELERILLCLEFIEQNQKEIMERELSIELFSDSKIFEKKYKSKLCRLLNDYGQYFEFLEGETDKKVINDIILSANQIVKNPTYIYFKGNGMLKFKDGRVVQLFSDLPMAISSANFADIKQIIVESDTVMTVENLTSYTRVVRDDMFVLFLSGYNNRIKSQFLMLVNRFNSISKWLHFGDIDPDGFYIFNHLREEAGLNIEPYKMSVSELEKYQNYCKPLTENDIQKAKLLLKKEIYNDVINYMIKNNCKLEQEIISWKEELIHKKPQLIM